MTSGLALHRVVVTLLIAGGAMGLLLSAGVGVAVGIREMKRIDHVRHAASLIGQGDLSRRFQMGGRDEIAMLLDVINHMLDEIERLMDAVKGASDGIAHNLRTPLARVRTLLTRAAERSNLLQQPQLSEMLDQAQHETDVVLERFAAMLRVAQIAGLGHRGGFDLIDLRELVADIGGLYAPLAESRGMTLTASAENAAYVRADRALVFEMLGNLMAHVLSQASSGANVRIALAMTERGPRLAIDSDRSSTAQAPTLEAGGSRDVSTVGDSCSTSLSVAWAVARMHGFALSTGRDEPSFTVDCWPQMSLSF
jgi:signal transduction histidine kinase